MIGNALVRRYAVSALRPQHLWVNVGIYAIGLALIGMLNALALKYGNAYDGLGQQCLRSAYGQLLAIQFLLLWAWGGHGAGSVLREEMLHKSYDFFRMLPLTPWQKLVGVTVGRNLLAIILAAVTAAVQFVVGLAGGVPVLLQAQLAFALVATTALMWCVPVLSSVRPTKGKSQRGISALLLIFFVLLAIPALIHLVALASSVVELARWKISFFGADLPGLFLVGAIASYAATWAAFGARRRLVRSECTLFSPTGAYGFLAGCFVIVLGLYWEKVAAGTPGMWFWYAAVTHALVGLMPFGLLRSYEQYMEWTHDLAQRHGTGKALDRRFLASANPATWAGLYALWAAGAVGVALMESLAMASWALAMVGCVFFAWAVFLMLVELAVVGAPRNEKMKFFMGFLVLLYLVLPMLLSVVLDEGTFYAFSYLGIWTALWQRVFCETTDELMLVLPFILNVLLAGVLATIIWRRYADLLHARRAMWTRARPTDNASYPSRRAAP